MLSIFSGTKGGNVLAFPGGEVYSVLQARLDAWARFDALVSSIPEDERLSFEDFPRLDIGRELVSFEDVQHGIRT